MILKNSWSIEGFQFIVWWLWKDVSNNLEPHPSRCFSVAGQYFRLCVLYQLFVVVLSFELGSQTLIGKEMWNVIMLSCGRSVVTCCGPFSWISLRSNLKFLWGGQVKMRLYFWAVIKYLSVIRGQFLYHITAHSSIPSWKHLFSQIKN